jgi:hypothetical protein
MLKKLQDQFTSFNLIIAIEPHEEIILFTIFTSLAVTIKGKSVITL